MNWNSHQISCLNNMADKEKNLSDIFLTCSDPLNRLILGLLCYFQVKSTEVFTKHLKWNPMISNSIPKPKI